MVIAKCHKKICLPWSVGCPPSRKEGKEVFLFGSRGGIMVIVKCHKKIPPWSVGSPSWAMFCIHPC